MIELIDENSKGPNISLGPINIMNEALRTHIERASDGDVFKGVLGLDGESKVSQFESVALNEDIGHFNIPVYDS